MQDNSGTALPTLSVKACNGPANRCADLPLREVSLDFNPAQMQKKRAFKARHTA